MSAQGGHRPPLQYVPLVLLGGCAALFLILSQGYNPTAALFPRWVAIATLLLLTALIIQLFGSDEGVAEPALEAVARPAVFAGQGMYILVIYLFGFFAATFLFLLIAPIHLRYKRRGVVLVHAVVLTLVVAGSFLWLFQIQLPTRVSWDFW